MLSRISELERCAIHATDGEIGRVSDVLFDDEQWIARWLVVRAGSWLLGREVLLPASHLGGMSQEKDAISVDLTQEQVKSSPGVETKLPVSRQMESSLYSHYGWSPYWGGLGATGAGASYLIPPVYVVTGSARHAELAEQEEMARRDQDPHLRSAAEVRGYHIEATDGDIGHVEDFLIDDESWTVRYIIVDTKNWWPGKFVLVTPEMADDIRWDDRKMRVRQTRQQIKGAPEYEPARRLERADEARFYGYYGIPSYWSEAAQPARMRR